MGESELAVKETGGTSEGLVLLPLMVLASPILISLCGFASIGLIGVTITFAVRGGRGQLGFSESGWLYILAWIAGVVTLLAGAVVSWALPITILVEEIMAFL